MNVKFISILLVAGLIATLTASPTTANSGKETIVWKDTSSQVIPQNKWTNLTFNGKTSIKQTKKTRALYCTQLHLATGKNKPRYVKMRFARQMPNGSLDTTATNTWKIGKGGPKVFHGSMCWSISTPYPVAVQVKVVGGQRSWVSTERQVKVWSPKGGIPEDYASFD
jgi:hypothetical protein